MKYLIQQPDGSPYDCYTLDEVRAAFKKGKITKDYLAQANETASWQPVGVLLGLEQPGESKDTGIEAARASMLRPSAPTPAMTEEQRRGRWFLLIPLVGLLVIDIAFSAVQVVLGGLANLIVSLLPSAVRIFLTMLLMSAVWAGMRWARCVLVGLLLGAGFYFACTVYSRFSPLLMSFAAIYLLCGLVIGFSKSVSSFLSFQRQRK